MKTLSLTTFLVFFFAWANAQYNTHNLSLDKNAASKQNNSYIYKNLQLYPIRANKDFARAHESVGDYDNLQQALDSGKIVIAEKGSVNTDRGPQPARSDRSSNRNDLSYSAGAEVNTLFIENRSDDTILLLAGEVVKGGQQDRVLSQDVLLKPHTKTDLSVFCVEPHRWSVDESGDGSFSSYEKVSTMSVRKKAAVNKEQQAVWNEVGRVNKVNATETASGTYTALKNSGKLQINLKEYVEHYENLFAGQSDIIGVVVVSGNKIMGCDMFATPELFQNNFSNLLHSYATEAISYGNTPSVAYEDVTSYLNTLLADENKQDELIERNGQMLKEKNVKYHITTF